MKQKIYFFLVLLTIVLFTPNIHANDYTVIYSIPIDVSNNQMEGYVIKNDALYICLAEEDKEKRTKNQIFTKTVIYKVENYKLQKTNDLTAEEAKEYISANKNNVINSLWLEEFQPMEDSGDLKGRRLKISNDKYIEFGSGADCTMTFVDGAKRKLIEDYLFGASLITYIYFEKDKIYFDGVSYKYKKRGIFSYNIATDEISDITSSYYNSREPFKGQNFWPSYVHYYSSVRVPNTPYLLFYMEKRINKGVLDEYKDVKWLSWEHFDIKNYFEIAIKEVPEWK